MGKTQFESFLSDEVEKLRGVYYPVRAGFFRRAFIRTLPCKKLHPNPNDEFCFPEIGPNYSIMSRYESDYMRFRNALNDPFVQSPVREPIEVEKISPDGYMILNGHHRWGAAMQAGIDKIRVKIVDLTQEKDLHAMLKAAASERRVTLDLDEVVFRPETDPCLEKPLRFPLGRIYKERLRLGIPFLFHKLNSSGYDIWVYSAGNLSLDYVRHYFGHYGIQVAGIITGTARKIPARAEKRKELKNLFDSRYQSTIHIGNHLITRTFRGSSSYDDYWLECGDETWSREVINIIEKMRQHE